jgi:hypothetical protein
MIVLSTSVWGYRFCFHEEEEVVVVGMEYFVYLADVKMQVFFKTSSRR